MTRSVLILGGSGFVGRALCEQLSRRFGAELRITVPTRRPAHAQGVQRRLMPGHDTVVNLIAILQGRPADFERVHAELPRGPLSAERASIPCKSLKPRGAMPG